ncbi:bifunctional pyrimidine biosynthesis protein, partial [Moniliophthora roreri]
PTYTTGPLIVVVAATTRLDLFHSRIKALKRIFCNYGATPNMDTSSSGMLSQSAFTGSIQPVQELFRNTVRELMRY